jgi:hypothetical protein
LPQNHPIMPSIKFTEIELGFLRNHYEQELIDAEMYVAEIRKILSKFGKTEKETLTSTTQKKRRGRPAKNAQPAAEESAVAIMAEKKARGRKPRRKKAKTAKVKAVKKDSAKKAVVKKRAKKVVPKKAAVKKPAKPVETPAPVSGTIA